MDRETSYHDETARFYDAFYRERDLNDVDFYVERAKAADGPVLEVACGTGRVYLDLLEAGVDVDGFDGSPEMLNRLREKAGEELDPTVWEADMRDFEVDREYGLVVVPFRAFLHLQTVEDQLSALGRFHDALRPDGELIVAFFAPDFDVICERYGEWDETEIEFDGEEYTVRTRPRLRDGLEQIMEEKREIVGPSGEIVAESSFQLKLVSKREFDLLLRLSPFGSWSVYGDFSLDELESTSQELVWIVEP